MSGTDISDVSGRGRTHGQSDARTVYTAMLTTLTTMKMMLSEEIIGHQSAQAQSLNSSCHLVNLKSVEAYSGYPVMKACQHGSLAKMHCEDFQIYL